MEDELKVLDKVFDNLGDKDFELSQAEKDIFKYGNYVNQMKAMGMYTSVPFEDVGETSRYVLAPYILKKMYLKIGSQGFEKLGIPGHFYYMKPSKGKENHKRVINRNIKNKKEFNMDLHKYFKKAHLIKMMMGDLDFLGEANSVDDEEFRKEYQEIGESFLDSLTYAIKENDAEVEIMMKVYLEGHNPYGGSIGPLKTAKKVASTGAKTYNHSKGEHTGIIFTDDITDDYKDQLLNVVNYISCIKDVSRKEQKIKKLSEATGLTQKKIKEVLKGENKLKHWETKAIEHFYTDVLYPSGDANGSAVDLDPKIKLIENENKIYYTLCRDFYNERDEKQVEEPQMHEEFWAGIFPCWIAAADHTNQRMDIVQKGERLQLSDVY